MTEETTPEVKPVVEPVAEPKVEPKAEPKEKELSPSELRKANADLQAHNKALNKENKQRREKNEAFEAAENKRKEAEMSETELLNKKNAELEAENKKLKLSSEQHSIAEKVGLPIAFAKRIQGNTLEEMEADAQALFDALPVKPKVDPGATNPGEKGGKQVETDAQRRKRLFS